MNELDRACIAALNLADHRRLKRFCFIEMVEQLLGFGWWDTNEQTTAGLGIGQKLDPFRFDL